MDKQMAFFYVTLRQFNVMNGNRDSYSVCQVQMLTLAHTLGNIAYLSLREVTIPIS